jgi:hypothetical protein
MHTAQEQYEYMVNQGMNQTKAATWARVNIIQGIDCIPHAVVEYANISREMPNLTSFYQGCRSRAPSLNYTFVGD